MGEGQRRQVTLYGRLTDFLPALLRCPICSPRVELWDRIPGARRSRLLGTGLVWRRARPSVIESLRHAALSALRVFEVFAVRVGPGQAERRYPFTALLYQSSAFKHLVGAHFPDRIVAKLMRDVGACGEHTPLSRQVVLWQAAFVRLCDR